MSKLFNLSLYENELNDSDYLCDEDFKMSQEEVSEILKGLEEGISILEKLGRSPSSEVLHEKNTLNRLSQKLKRKSL